MSIRVLEVFREPITSGGQESFLMNMYTHIDRDTVQMDFFTPFTCDNKHLENEVHRLGGQVFHCDHIFGKNNNFIFKKCVEDFLTTHEYTTVHFHSGSTYALMIGSKIAHKLKVKNIIVHSHCGGFPNLKYRLIKAASVPYLMKYPTAYFACSELAAEWKFPRKVIANHGYKIIKNAIDLTRFRYDPNVREQYRAQFGCTTKLVIGHVGRFAQQKNHQFLIEVFHAVHQAVPESCLVLVGDGERKSQVEEQVHSLGLDKDVLFMGLRNDIPELMNMMDAFVMPSFFEGLPVVGVEAQATGLPLYLADTIAKELPIPSLTTYISLSQGAQEWANSILQTCHAHKRQDTSEQIIEQGYEVVRAAKLLQNYYVQMNK